MQATIQKLGGIIHGNLGVVYAFGPVRRLLERPVGRNDEEVPTSSPRWKISTYGAALLLFNGTLNP